MISREAFMKLKAGDVVLYNGKERIVREGPADMKASRGERSIVTGFTLP
jgi:hypothetical protein